MNEEQEGINLEMVNSDGNINLPSVEEPTEPETTETEPVKEETTIDKEKEDLKKGVNYERKMRKEAEKQNKELVARIEALENANKASEKTTLETLLESGIEEGIAKSIASVIDKKQEGSKKAEQELNAIKFKYELSEKSKDSNFSDIMDYEDDIKDLCDKGLSIEQAYYALSYDKSKTINTKSEIERKVEAKLQNNQDRKDILGNINSNAGGVASTNDNKPKATSLEIAAAKAAGMDINDYLAAKNANSIKDYNSYLSKKTK